MSDPYAWLDTEKKDNSGVQTVADDPYAWLDNKPKEKEEKKVAAASSQYRADAEARVASERKSGGIGRAVADTGWNLLRGTPVGSFADEAAAVISNPKAAVYAALDGEDSEGAADYYKNLEYQRAANRGIDKDSTVIGKLPLIGDVTVGGVTKLAGGVLSGGALARGGMGLLQVMRGNTAIPTIANLGATGLAAGAVYGAGEGEGGALDRLQSGAIGGWTGALAGPAGYLAGRGVASTASRLGSFARSAAQGRPQALQPYDPGAVRRVQRAIVDDNLTTQRNYARQSGTLGREGMLLDMGDNLRGQAGAIANAPGAGQTRVKGALNARNLLSRDRLTTAVDGALGREGASIQFGGQPVQRFNTLEEGVDAVRQQTQAIADPLYDQFRNTQIQMTPQLRNLIRRAEALDPRIVDRARSTMIADNQSQSVRSNNSALFDYVRRDLDALANTAAKNENMNQARIAGNIAREINQELDSALQAQGSRVYAEAREAAGEGLQFAEGTRDGLRVLGDNALTAQGLRDTLGRVPPSQAAGMRVGAREDLRRRMVNAKSAFGSEAATNRGASRGRDIISSDEARAKINALALSPEAARNLIRTADAEGRFAASSQAITGNSATAARLAAQAEFPNAIPSVDVANEMGKKTMAGAGAEAAYRTLNFVMNGTLDERRTRIAADAARMLVARGASRDQIVQAIMQQAQRQGISAARQEALANLAATIARSTDPAIMSAAGTAGQ